LTPLILPAFNGNQAALSRNPKIASRIDRRAAESGTRHWQRRSSLQIKYNPPYSQAWNPSDKEADPRYARFGLAPKSKADYAFLLHDLFHIKSNGIMTIVLPHGVLFRGGEEGEIRKHLIENNKIDAIIGLPANIFFGTGIPTIIMVLKHRKENNNTDILIVDASKGFEKVGKNNKLRACDIKKIVDVVKERKTVDKFSKLVSRAEVRENDYNLNIPRYVDSSEKAESWDIYASMFGGIPASEIDEFAAYWNAFPHLKDAILQKVNDSYYSLKTDDIKAVINACEDVQAFKAAFNSAFGDFDAYLENRLISRMTELAITKEESVLSDNIFERLADIPLIDEYEAYQLLSNEWNKISVDLEVIQTEGASALTQVDPNMVIKKKNGKDTEVQEGYIGHIIPFELVQSTMLTAEKDAIAAKENRLAEIASEYQEIIDGFSEEEKEGDYLNEAKDAFVATEVKKAIKAKTADDSVLEQLLKVSDLITEEKNLKSDIKKDTESLHLLTKETIEGLSQEEANALLKAKWITPLIEQLYKLPEAIIDNLIAAIKAKMNKYSSTFSDIEKEIEETEKALSAMIDDLVGDEFEMQGLQAFKALLGGN
jgi:type I restriction enzyme M protein